MVPLEKKPFLANQARLLQCLPGKVAENLWSELDMNNRTGSNVHLLQFRHRDSQAPMTKVKRRKSRTSEYAETKMTVSTRSGKLGTLRHSPRMIATVSL
jgi:hypothetical protein